MTPEIFFFFLIKHPSTALPAEPPKGLIFISFEILKSGFAGEIKPSLSPAHFWYPTLNLGAAPAGTFQPNTPGIKAAASKKWKHNFVFRLIQKIEIKAGTKPAALAIPELLRAANLAQAIRSGNEDEA